MVSYSGPWKEEELVTFLTESTFPIRIGVHRQDGSMWIVPLWYRYLEGRFECATSVSSDLVRFLEHDPNVALDISTNHPPYRGVRGRGESSLAFDEEKETLHSLIERYLGSTDSSLADWLLDEGREEIRIRIRPRELHSWDYTDRMQTIETVQNRG